MRQLVPSRLPVGVPYERMCGKWFLPVVLLKFVKGRAANGCYLLEFVMECVVAGFFQNEFVRERV